MSRSNSRDPFEEFRKELERLRQDTEKKIEEIRKKALEEIDRIVKSTAPS